MIQESKKNLSTDLLPLDSAKKTLQMLFRQLIMMTQTLEPLPGREISSSHCSDAIDENKFISIRLYYVDSTPEDYQPSGFVEASDSTSLKFVTKFAGDVPYDQRVGALNTGFHACTLKITTLSDLDGGPADDQNSRPYVQIWDAEANAKAVDTLAIPSDAVPESQMLAPPIFEKLHISGQEPPGHDADISPEPDILPPSQIEKLVCSDMVITHRTIDITNEYRWQDGERPLARNQCNHCGAPWKARRMPHEFRDRRFRTSLDKCQRSRIVDIFQATQCQDC